ncbi:Hypothetical predicted protein, partial [Marmota monax]
KPHTPKGIARGSTSTSEGLSGVYSLLPTGRQESVNLKGVGEPGRGETYLDPISGECRQPAPKKTDEGKMCRW